MTPAARISGAIEVLDRIQAGALADRALAEWGRQNRYAGSKDRAAIGDIVYDVLRCKQSCARLGGGETGRALALGYLRQNGQDPATVFGAGRYAPSELTRAELSAGDAAPEDIQACSNFPQWLWAELVRSDPENAPAIAQILQERAPVHLRVNLQKTPRDRVRKTLAQDGVLCAPSDLSPGALQVTEGGRRIRQTQAYQNGEVELQDASSQAVADMVPLQRGETLLDFCAGGGGKSLAVAGRVSGRFFAHDLDPRRMKDLPVRALRAGVQVQQISLGEIELAAPFDAVLIDVPCSGSGSWRRDPQGKWLLSSDKLDHVRNQQRQILNRAAGFVKPKGHLIYATCSLLACENEDQTQAFLARNPAFEDVTHRRFSPLSGGDGFFCAVLRRK